MRLTPTAGKVNKCKMYKVNMSRIGARTKRSSQIIACTLLGQFCFIAVQLISRSTIQNKFSCSRTSHANMSALKEKRALSALKETSLKWIMDTLTVCSLPLKRGSWRQKSFFLLIGFPLCSISTEHHRIQKGLYHPVSDGLEVILLFLGLEVETCRECLAQLLAIFSATGMQAVTICQWTRAY